MIFEMLLTLVAAAQRPGPPLLASELVWEERAPRRRAAWTADPLLARYPTIVRRLRAEAVPRVRLGRDECTEWMPCFRTMRHELGFAGVRLVTIFEEYQAYLGGAHGAGGAKDWIWDVARGRRIQFREIFSDWVAARAILQPRLCERLRQFSEGREIECPDVGDVALGLAEHPEVAVGGPASLIEARTSDYQLGSFAEGREEVLIEIDAALFALIRPEYRADIEAPRS